MLASIKILGKSIFVVTAKSTKSGGNIWGMFPKVKISYVSSYSLYYKTIRKKTIYTSKKDKTKLLIFQFKILLKKYHKTWDTWISIGVNVLNPPESKFLKLWEWSQNITKMSLLKFQFRQALQPFYLFEAMHQNLFPSNLNIQKVCFLGKVCLFCSFLCNLWHHE